METIGILGGMGPEATVLLMQRLIDCIDANDDADHIPLIVHNNPQIPSRIKALIEKNGPSPVATLCSMARALEAAGCASLAMPCNTAHYYADDIAAAVEIPLINMIEETTRHMRNILPGPTRVGILASPAIRLTGVFDKPMRKAGLIPVYPEDDSDIFRIIKTVKGAGPSASLGAQLAAQARFMTIAHDCPLALIACTELSLLTRYLPSDIKWVDSLDVLVSQIKAVATQTT